MIAKIVDKNDFNGKKIIHVHKGVTINYFRIMDASKFESLKIGDEVELVVVEDSFNQKFVVGIGDKVND